MLDLSLGPSRSVNTWQSYHINGYKFHTLNRGRSRQTNNSGICVKASSNSQSESDFYGMLNEVVEIEYAGSTDNRLVLFSCHWFDPVRGMKVNQQYGIVEVHHGRSYPKYDPFIFASNAVQVYYASYPSQKKGKSNWWVVFKVKPRSIFDGSNTIEVPFQEDEICNVVEVEPQESVEALNEEGQFELLNITPIAEEASEHEEASDYEEDASDSRGASDSADEPEFIDEEDTDEEASDEVVLEDDSDE
jgi:hypothetical protein